MNRVKGWGIGVLVILLVAAGGALATRPWLGSRLARTLGLPTSPGQGRGALETLGVYWEVPDFALVERSGRRVTRTELLGKVWIANFFYTECTETCPLQSASMARLQADLAGEKDVRLVSISIDPAHDSPQVLSEYATRFRADPERWLFLTGSKDAIYRLAIEGFRLGVTDQGEKVQRAPGGARAWLEPVPAWAHPVPNPERKPIIHSSRFVLVDRHAQIRGYYHGTDSESLERLRRDARVVLRETLRQE